MLLLSSRCVARVTRSLRTFASVRSYAIARPPKPSISSNTQQTSINKRLGETLEDSKRRYVVESVYNSGRKVLYKAPSQFAYIFSGQLAAGACFGGVFGCYWLGYYDEATRKKQGLSWIVGTGYRLGMLMFGLAAGWALYSTFNLVTLIKLVKHGNQGSIRILVHRRRLIPFLRPRKFVVPTSHLTMSEVLIPGTRQAVDLTNNRQFLYQFWDVFKQRVTAIPYNWKRITTGEDFVQVSIRTGNDTHYGKLDLHGEFSNDGSDLLKIVQFEEQ